MSGDKGVGVSAAPVVGWEAVAAAMPWVAALMAAVTMAAISTGRAGGGGWWVIHIPEPAGPPPLPLSPVPLPLLLIPPKGGPGVPTSGLAGVKPAP